TPSCSVTHPPPPARPLACPPAIGTAPPPPAASTPQPSPTCSRAPSSIPPPPPASPLPPLPTPPRNCMRPTLSSPGGCLGTPSLLTDSSRKPAFGQSERQKRRKSNCLRATQRGPTVAEQAAHQLRLDDLMSSRLSIRSLRGEK